MRKIIYAGIASILVALICDGCASTTLTKPAESATEQLVFSTAVDRALGSVDFGFLAGRKVYLDTTDIQDAYHYQYAIGDIRDALSRAGALLATNRANSDVIIEARAGALSDDNSSTLIGIPGTPAAVPLAVAFSLPEIALYKSEDQRGYAKLALFAYANKSRQHIFSTGPLDGKSYDYYHEILFISWITTDIPELKSKKAAEKLETWFPQYDLTNLPAATPAKNASPANGGS
jgi:hypothetical protein